MKRALYLVAILFAMLQGVFAAQNPSDSLADRLRKSILGEADSAVAITMEEITTATAEKRKLLVAAACQIIDGALKEPQPWSRMNNHLIAVSADILRKISDEDTIVAVFASRLDQIEPNAICEIDAIYALCCCQNPVAIEAIAKLARQRLKEITPWLPEPPPSTSEDQKQRLNAVAGSFLHALGGLAASNSTSGRNTARELREKYLKLFVGSPYYKDVRRDIENTIDVLLKGGAQSSVRRIGTVGAISRSLPEQPQQSRSVTPAPVSVSSQTRGASKIGMAIAAVVAGVIIVGVLIWFLRNK